ALVALEATGYFWRNLFHALVEWGYVVAVLNPLRVARFCEEELQRTKTDELDALAIAKFALQKRPRPTPLFDRASDELREFTRLRSRLIKEANRKARQLDRTVHLAYPEFTSCIRTIDSDLAV